MTAIRGTEQIENREIYSTGNDRQYLIITITIVAVTYLISMSTDCLGIVLELNGILAAVPLAYILPALCYLRLEPGPLMGPLKLPALSLLVAGVFAAVSGLLLIIFKGSDSASCIHGGVMSYCEPKPSLSDAGSTVVTTAASEIFRITTPLKGSIATAAMPKNVLQTLVSSTLATLTNNTIRAGS